MFTRRASMPPTGRSALGSLCMSRRSFPMCWVATSQAWSARLARASQSSAPGMRYLPCAMSVQEGAYAEKIAIKADIVARKPASLGHVEAAALAVPGLTALIVIEDTLQLRAGETILIQGGAGGVGSVAIQLAKHIGARVITTASAANHTYVRGLGADEVIDYNAQDFTKAASGCDAALDTVGGDVAQRSFAVLKPGGRAAFIASGSQAPKASRGDVQSLRPNVARDRHHLERLVALFEAGAIRVPVVTRFPISEAAAAHGVSQTRHFRGKLVLVVR